MKRTIKGIRTDLGLSQSEMAEAVGLSLEQYKNIEQGRTKLLAITLVKICMLSKITDITEIDVEM